MACGTDQSSGPAPQRERELLADAGIAPLDVIRIATYNSALFLGKADQLGSIDTGKLLEGIEVVFIVIELGAGGKELLMPASLGALAALLVVIAVGAAVHRPLCAVAGTSFVCGPLGDTVGERAGRCPSPLTTPPA